MKRSQYVFQEVSLPVLHPGGAALWTPTVASVGIEQIIRICYHAAAIQAFSNKQDRSAHGIFLSVFLFLIITYLKNECNFMILL